VRVNLSEDDSGGTRDLRLGDEVTVILGENPTTGYRWHADIDTTRLQLTDDQYHGAERPVGAGGTRRLTFAPLNVGPRTHDSGTRPPTGGSPMRSCGRRTWRAVPCSTSAVGRGGY